MIKEVTKEEMLVLVTNHIKTHYPHARQKAKSPFFLLQYDGTWIGLMKQFGFSEKIAKGIQKGYDSLYSTFIQFVKDCLKSGYEEGYVTGAFGLRLFTPIMQNAKGNSRKKHLAEAEGRSAGNMVGGQSYCALTLRALGNFMKRVHVSKWRYDIAPISTIYDSIYLEIPDDPECVVWVNKNLIECMCDITGAPELEHDVVKVGANLCVYYPNWSVELEMPNGITKEELVPLMRSALAAYKAKTS